ncbi:hypothetical protein AAG570_003755 [Ranatra chinensis]|uniref:Uncharacterized protein n=1 Tax=Ranatra chinensis TaxID=642074 RepID=A0ABD0Y4M1_9HEMI
MRPVVRKDDTHRQRISSDASLRVELRIRTLNLTELKVAFRGDRRRTSTDPGRKLVRVESWTEGVDVEGRVETLERANRRYLCRVKIFLDGGFCTGIGALETMPDNHLQWINLQCNCTSSRMQVAIVDQNCPETGVKDAADHDLRMLILKNLDRDLTNIIESLTLESINTHLRKSSPIMDPGVVANQDKADGDIAAANEMVDFALSYVSDMIKDQYNDSITIPDIDETLRSRGKEGDPGGYRGFEQISLGERNRRRREERNQRDLAEQESTSHPVILHVLNINDTLRNLRFAIIWSSYVEGVGNWVTKIPQSFSRVGASTYKHADVIFTQVPQASFHKLTMDLMTQSEELDDRTNPKLVCRDISPLTEEVLFVRVQFGTFSARNGRLKGLASISRQGDSRMTSQNSIVNIFTNLVFKSLQPVHRLFYILVEYAQLHLRKPLLHCLLIVGESYHTKNFC